ncbi:MAG: fibronectin type III domain-containing protein [Thermoguttaceae bacterium]|nr:fibronectin type III domain-containing protein [Thermoguttaceae bacterium]
MTPFSFSFMTKRSARVSAENSTRKRAGDRSLRFERLEDRRLLSVTAAEYADIRASYPELGLPESAADVNIIEIRSNQLTIANLKTALSDASHTKADDLIVLRTTESSNTIRYGAESHSITVSYNSASYGSTTIVGYGEKPLTIDANAKARGANLSKGTFGLANIAVVNGARGKYGGGVYVGQATVTMVDCSIRDNYASLRGGGLYNHAGDVKLYNVELVGNHTVDAGGGVYISEDAVVEAHDCLVKANYATGSGCKSDGAGGVMNCYGALTMDGCAITENRSNKLAGGVFSLHGELTLTRCVFENNKAPSSFGGGLVCDGDAATVRDCVFRGNTSRFAGGAAFAGGPVEVVNCAFIGNEASDRVGGLQFIESYGSVVNTVVACNTANKIGGVSFDDCSVDGGMAVYNSIFALNSATNNDIDVYNSNSELVGYNTLSSYKKWVGGADNIRYNANLPLFRDAKNGDFNLAEGSQAIDKGNDDYAQAVGLDATSLDLNGNKRFSGNAIDLGPYEATPGMTFEYDAAAKRVSLEWNEISGAASYKVLLSRNGGSSWVKYKSDLTTTSTVVNSITAGSSYVFKVVGVDSSGKNLSNVFIDSFAPVGLTAQTTVFSIGETINVSLVAADDASADIRWYYVTENGDVEIPEAAGLLSFTPDDALYDVKVVATGQNRSDGSGASVVIVAKAAPLDVSYDTATRKTTLSWAAIPGAVSYKTLVSKNGGSWTTYKKDIATTSVVVSGLYAGNSWDFRVVGVDASGKTLVKTREGTLAPIALTASSATYAAGATISVAVQGSENASADVRWYYATSDGDVEIVEAAGRLTYAPSTGDYNIKVVATGTGDSTGSVAETTIVSDAPALTCDYDASTRQVTLQWRPVDNAQTYRVYVRKDGGSWALSKNNLKTRSAVINGLYVGRSWSFRVVGVDAAGTELAESRETTLAPISISAAPASFAAGEPISVTITGAANASCDVKWFAMTASGDVEISDAAGRLVYTPTTASYGLRIVATGTGDSAGSSARTVVIPASSPIAFAYDATTRQANLSWEPIQGAATYKLMLSKNGGQTWASYKTGLTEPAAVVNAVYLGSSYSFRVVGVDSANKALPANYEGTFAPVAVAASNDVYEEGDAVTVAVTGAENASIDLRWYYVGDNGDVEIPEARGLFSYVPKQSEYDVRVVAVGVGDSSGAISSVKIRSSAPRITFDYNASARQATLNWKGIPGAATYKLYLSKNNGSTWVSYKTGLTEPTAVVSGFYVGNRWGFKVVGYDSAGKQLPDFYQEFFTATDDSSSILDEAFADFFEETL